ncbi:MAG: hypothetical protein ABJH52_17165 [Henriciella sp.]
MVAKNDMQALLEEAAATDGPVPLKTKVEAVPEALPDLDIFQRLGLADISIDDKRELFHALMEDASSLVDQTYQDAVEGTDGVASDVTMQQISALFANGKGQAGLSDFLKQKTQEKIDNARRHHDAIMDATPMDKFLPCDDHINMRIPTHAKKILNERADGENKTLSQYLIYCANLVALLQGKEPFLLVAPRGFFMKRAARMAKGG